MIVDIVPFVNTEPVVSTAKFMKLAEIAQDFKDKGKGPKDLSSKLGFKLVSGLL